MAFNTSSTVGRYLASRLQEFGLHHELNVGYAADARRLKNRYDIGVRGLPGEVGVSFRVDDFEIGRHRPDLVPFLVVGVVADRLRVTDEVSQFVDDDKGSPTVIL